MALIQLTEAEQEEIKEIIRRTKDARVLRRARAVLALDQGKTANEVSEHQNVSLSAIYEWKQRVVRERDVPLVERLRNRRQQQRLGKSTTKHQKVKALLSTLLRTNPGEHGYPAPVWTAPLLWRHLTREHRLQVSKSTIVMVLKELQYHYRRSLIDEDELKRLCEQEPPMTVQEIADHIGVAKQWIHAKMKTMGLKRKMGKRKLATNRERRRAHKNLYTCPVYGGPKSFGAERCRQCQGKSMVKEGGTVDTYGYVRVNRATKREYGVTFEHQLVATQVLGRRLEPGEGVFHKDGNRANNSPDNLYVVKGKHRIDLAKG